MRGVQRIRCARFLDDMVFPVHNIVPGAAMPVVVAAEDKYAGAFQIERYIAIIRKLIKKMGTVSAFISSTAVIRAPHVCTHADPLLGPAIPEAIGIESDGNAAFFCGAANHRDQQKECRATNAEAFTSAEARHHRFLECRLDFLVKEQRISRAAIPYPHETRM